MLNTNGTQTEKQEIIDHRVEFDVTSSRVSVWGRGGDEGGG